MNIVVLDGYTLNPGDFSWDDLYALGKCSIYDRTSRDQIIERTIDAHLILTNKVPITKEILSQLPKLQYIGVLATGYNIVDVNAAMERNITVTNVPAYSTMSVAQTTFALLLELTHHIGHHSTEVKNGRWSNGKDFSFFDVPLHELSGKTFGIIGFGNIGKATAKIALAFGMKVHVYTKTAQPLTSDEIQFTECDSLFKTSDIISLHCPLTEQNRLLVNTHRLSLMKPTAMLLNTSRGGLIDEYALAEALHTNKIAGAGLDVLSTEPPDKNNPLLTAKHCIITPHYAWASVEARQRLMACVIENIKSFLAGKPVNIVTLRK